jgi:sugar phosphate isomerase/epimerase
MRRGILADHQRKADGGPGMRIGSGSIVELIPEFPKLGFRFLEIFLDPALDDPAERKWFVDFAARARDLGLDLWSMHVPFSRDISVADGAARGETLRGIESSIALAAAAGARFAVVHPGSETPPEERPSRVETSVRSLTRLNAFCRDHGIRMAVENMLPTNVAEGARGLRGILDRLPHDAGVCFDTGHAHVTDGSPAKALEVIKDRLLTLHVHDNDGTGDQHRIPGEGGIDWPGFARGLAAAGFGGVFMLEIGGKRSPLEILELAKSSLDRFLGPLGAES